MGLGQVRGRAEVEVEADLDFRNSMRESGWAQGAPALPSLEVAGKFDAGFGGSDLPGGVGVVGVW